MSTQYDAVVIGAGPGGYVAAIHGAQIGLKVAIVEKDDRLGGTCLLRGCIPTKALLESASLYERIHKADKFGISVDGVSLDFPGVHKYKADVVDANAKGVVYLMKKYGVDVVHGFGKVISPNKVGVKSGDEEQVLDTKHIVLATGSRCASLPFIDMDHERIINSDDLLELEEIPEHLIVMGAGAVGAEFASVFVRFGSKVDLIELQDHVLPIEDHEISKHVERSFKKQGINVLTSTKVKSVQRDGDTVNVEVELPDGKTKTLSGDMMLVAVGRAAVTDGLGLEEQGIGLDKRGQVEIDELGRTAVDNIYAIGDIVDTPWLAHVASHEGVIAMEDIAGRNPHPIKRHLIPNCTYCHPEVASVGLTEREARKRGYDVKVATFPFKANGKAKIAQETDGIVKVVAEKKYDELLGVHIVGHHATELIAESSAAIRLETTTEELMHTIHPHPTLSEVMGEVAHAAVMGDPLHF